MKTNAILLAALTAAAPMMVRAQDASAWNGFNIGLQASSGTGEHEYDSGALWDLEGESYGVFVGYLTSRGGWAYGAELAYAEADFHEVSQTTGELYENYYFNYTLDLKGRFGYAHNRTLFYGVLGYGFSEFYNDNPPLVGFFDASGPLFGVGVDYLATDQLFVGAELLKRQLRTDYGSDADLLTASMRLGWRF